MIDQQIVNLIKDAKTRLVSPSYGKFIDEDVSRDARLGDAALAFIQGYDGTFDFLVSIRDQFAERGHLSNRQLASVVNCMVAEITRQERSRAQGSGSGSESMAPWTGTPKIPNGIYTIKYDDGSYKTLRLRDTFEARAMNMGEQVACYLNGPDNETSYQGFAFVHGSEILMFKRHAASVELKKTLESLLADEETARKMGVEYARMSGNCYICNHILTTPESIEAGIGPICAGKGA